MLGSSNQEKGSVQIKETGGEQIVTVNEPNLAALTVTFDRGKERMQLTMGGRTGTVRPDRAAKKWIEDSVCAEIKAERITAVLLAGAVLDDVVMVPRMKARKPPSSRIDPLGEPIADMV